MDPIKWNLRLFAWHEIKQAKLTLLHPKEQVLAKMINPVLPDEETSFQYLMGDKIPPDDEIERLLTRFRGYLEPDEFFVKITYENFSTEFLKENVMYLFEILRENHIKSTDIAKSISVSENTVSRWSTGHNVPSGKRLKALKEHLGNFFDKGLLEHLDDSPLFLEMTPPEFKPGTVRLKKKELKDQIDKLPEHELDLIYHALKKLLQ